MMRRAHATYDMATVLGCGVFCMSMNLMYIISTLFHALHKFERVGSIFGALDHAAIYVRDGALTFECARERTRARRLAVVAETTL